VYLVPDMSGSMSSDKRHDPTKILACPETCETIQGAAGARIDIVLGCKTIVLLE
jgi:hypothetical protein